MAYVPWDQLFIKLKELENSGNKWSHMDIVVEYIYKQLS